MNIIVVKYVIMYDFFLFVWDKCGFWIVVWDKYIIKMRYIIGVIVLMDIFLC